MFTKSIHAQSWQWVKQAGGQSYDLGTGICYDPSGYIYSTGKFRNEGIFGTDTITSSQNTVDIYIAKHDTLGNVIWLKKAGGVTDGFEAGTSIVNDNAGNIYVTGYFDGPATFDMTTVSPFSNTADIFLAKYDSSGSLIWLKHMDTGFGYFTDFYPTLGVDDLDNVYLYGHYQGDFPSNQVSFDGEILVVTDAQSMFLAKYNSNGLKQWVKTINGINYYDSGYKFDLTTDGDGNSFITGSFKDTATGGSSTVISAGNSDVFIAKYDNAGNLNWVKSGGGSESDQGKSIAVDFHNNVYVSGLFWGTASFDAASITATTAEATFLAKYDYNGTLIWLKKFGGAFNNQITTDTFGNCFLASMFYSNNGSFQLGQASIVGIGNPEFYIAKIDPSGNVSGSIFTNAQDLFYYNFMTDIVVDNNGGCYTNGYFMGNSIFDSINLINYDDGSNNILYTKSHFNSPVTGGLEDQMGNQLIEIYPNPSNGIVNIDMQEDNYTVKVFDQTGKCILAQNSFMPHLEINMSSFSTGVYFVKITGNLKEYFGKIIKE